MTLLRTTKHVLAANIPLWVAAPFCLLSTLAGGWLMAISSESTCSHAVHAESAAPRMETGAAAVVTQQPAAARFAVDLLPVEPGTPLIANVTSSQREQLAKAGEQTDALTDAERDAAVRALLGTTEAMKGAEPEAVTQALASVIADDERTVDARIEAAYLITRGYQASLPEEASTHLLTLAQNSDDLQLQQDVLYAFEGRMTSALIASVSEYATHNDAGVRETALQLLAQLKNDAAARITLQQISQEDASDYLRYLARRALDTSE